MDDSVIKVQKLGKRYKLGQRGANYATLRDSIAGIFKNKTKAKNQFIWALQDVGFDVKKGEVVGIIGRNGAGKSTLLKMLSRITDPTEGRVELTGRIGSLLEVGTGFHPELTGRENIYLNGSIIGMRKREIEEKFDEIVAFSEIEKFIDTPVKFYSSGMYVRLAFAVAAHLEPEILLVDEVLAVGDVKFQRKCLGKMKDVAGEGRTVLFVSHNMGAVSNLCSRALLLESGKLVLDSSVEEVVSRYLESNVVKGAVASFEQIQERMEGIIKRDNPFVRVNAVSLQDKTGRLRDTFHSDEEINVSIQYKCFQPVRDLRIVVQIVDENNTPIVLSQNLDDEIVLEKNHSQDAGDYKACCLLPANLFGGRRYGLTIHLIYPKTEHIVLNKILEFDVEFKGYNNVQYGSGDKAFVRPLLKWDINREEKINEE